MIQLDLQSRMPIYEQLKRKMIELMMLEVLKANDQLPSVRNLARDLGVNPNTVSKAYQELERDGVIYSVTGKGSFVAEFNNTANAMKKQVFERLEQVLNDTRAAGIVKNEVDLMVCRVYEGGIR